MMIVEFPLLDVQETPTGPKGRVFVNPAHVKTVTAGIRRYPRGEEATTDAVAASNPHDYTCIFMAGDDGARWYIDMPIDEVVKELNDPGGVWFKQVSEALNQSMELVLGALLPQPAIQGESPETLDPEVYPSEPDPPTPAEPAEEETKAEDCCCHPKCRFTDWGGINRKHERGADCPIVHAPAFSPVVPAPTETGPKGTAAELREFAENLIADIENREPWTASQIAEHIEENFQ